MDAEDIKRRIKTLEWDLKNIQNSKIKVIKENQLRNYMSLISKMEE